MTRTPIQLLESSFEEYIQDYLVGHGYLIGDPKDYNKEYAMDTKILFDFLEDSQMDELQKLKNVYKGKYIHKVKERISAELNRKGTVGVLRHGIKDHGVHLKLAYFKPVTTMNKETAELYKKNRVSLIRQLHYSKKNENSVDMAIFINGLPVAIIELKNTFTGQNYENAINQFKKDRSPKEILFSFMKRAFVFFAVDNSEVHMATRLAGSKTVFLPFNQGHGGGKGNPPAEKGYSTSYLWEEVIQKDSLLDIIKRYIHVENEEVLVFPRYHQLDVVRKVEADVKKEGAGKNYLIQHSAGSGKTKSISWLAHGLSSLHNNDVPVFDGIVVVTDRRNLDKQLQDSIYQLEHKLGVIEKIEKDSAQLANALKSGVKIVISTLQKFPYIVGETSNLGDRKYAIIIDEAHSSTSGENIGSLRETLSADSLEEVEKLDSAAEEFDLEEEIIKEIRKRGIQPNISFFAFTATPKAKTIETFGTIGRDGIPESFHIYSMKQAIEEKFIIDVLQNYMTYETFYNIAKKIQDDPAFERAKATKALTRFVSLHPTNIMQKTEIMVEHFFNVTRFKVGGMAKAMLVTSSRLHAIRYKLEFDKYIKQKGYSEYLKTLVAFTGTVDDRGVKYTETDMNKIKETEIPEYFNTSEYQVLIVAEKYQTGFDQPKLHTMYVDKKLSGLKAVQTLSRLNRICKGKEDTFILDFVNNAEDIQTAFKPYYETTIIEEKTDPNIVYDMETDLKAYCVYQQSELDYFAKVYFQLKDKKSSNGRASLSRILDKAVARYRDIDKESQEKFRSQVTKFIRTYTFLLQITPFEDIGLYKLHLYLTYLIRKLPRDKGTQLHLFDEIALEYYTNKMTFEGSISLEGENIPVIPVRFPGDGKKKDEKEKLSTIIERINNRFGTDFTAADQLSIEQIQEDFARDEDMVLKVKTNTIDDFKYPFVNEFMNKVVERMERNEEFFTKILNDEEFKNALIEEMLKETYIKLQDL